MGAGATPAGWYPDVEQPGGERYWDGSLWTEQRRNVGDTAAGFPSTPPDSGPQPFGGQPPAYGQQPPEFGGQPPAYGQQPPPYGGQPPAYGQPGSQPPFGSPAGYTPYGATGSAYPPSAVAGWALGLSISGLVLSICCFGFVLSIPGTIMGWTTMKAIDRGEKDPKQRGIAKAAFIVGIVGLAVFALWIVAFIVNGTFTWSS